MSTNVRKTCRICGSDKLTPVLDLGAQLLASVTVTAENQGRIPDQPIPLEIVRCDTTQDENACGLVQLKHTYPSDQIYREYWYRSGINQTMRDVLKDVVNAALRNVDLRPGDVVVDIGCNDGTLLNTYERDDINCFGFDPVENIRGEVENFTRVTDYFNGPKLQEVSGGKKARIITSIAMFYDLEDPNKFVGEIADGLDEDGIWIVQMADLPEMLKHNMFDQIVHEHLEYYHVKPFKFLVEKHGLKIVDIEKNNANGSSYRFYVRKAGGRAPDEAATKRIADILNEEASMGFDAAEPYDRFREGCEEVKAGLVKFIAEAKKEGKKVVAYGASTKGNVILQYCGFTAEDISCVADRNPRKWGGWTIGSGIPIVSEEDARNMNPDYFLVFPYYFIDEMLKRESDFLARGGKFVVPIPTVHTVDATTSRG